VGRYQFYLNGSVRRLRAPRVDSATGRCAIVHCANCTCGVEPDMCPQQPGFKSGGLHHLGAMQERVYHGRNYDTVDQLKQATVLEWRALPRCFIDHSIGKWRRCLQCVVDQNGGHIQHMFHCLYYRPTVKSLLLQTLCWNIFWFTAQCSLQINSLDQCC